MVQGEQLRFKNRLTRRMFHKAGLETGGSDWTLLHIVIGSLVKLVKILIIAALSIWLGLGSLKFQIHNLLHFMLLSCLIIVSHVY